MGLPEGNSKASQPEHISPANCGCRKSHLKLSEVQVKAFFLPPRCFLNTVTGVRGSNHPRS